MRGIPGLNISQTSARDINLTARQSTNTLATSQLVLVDGRTLYQDFFGFVLWDLLPVTFQEIEQIEVIRGAASAVWGANAMTGVVNVRTKSPRRLGNILAVRAGGGVQGGQWVTGTAADRDETGASSYASVLFSGVRDDWSYKASGSFFTQDAWARPQTADNIFQTPINIFPNEGTDQPKLDVRVDKRLGGPSSSLSFAGGVGRNGGHHPHRYRAVQHR